MYIHKFVNGDVRATIPGWSSYKIHRSVLCAKGGQSVRMTPGAIIEVEGSPDNSIVDLWKYANLTPAAEPKQCDGCGARETIFKNGRPICSYCKGEKDGDLRTNS